MVGGLPVGGHLYLQRFGGGFGGWLLCQRRVCGSPFYRLGRFVDNWIVVVLRTAAEDGRQQQADAKSPATRGKCPVQQGWYDDMVLRRARRSLYVMYGNWWGNFLIFSELRIFRHVFILGFQSFTFTILRQRYEIIWEEQNFLYEFYNLTFDIKLNSKWKSRE